ncbi:hypothetical protein Patl1_15537 [Pistacia atlantica]|uniref:Uncharacterized protein n=1 Tax=Pistacia atlantica TaxID=434234 RepID=A0ACC1B937_9ROSI|nr:hypothetical protein Patl1_15537 [Pistacia atlantica]
MSGENHRWLGKLSNLAILKLSNNSFYVASRRSWVIVGAHYCAFKHLYGLSPDSFFG